MTRYRIVNIIPPRPGAKIGTLVLDPEDRPPVESVTVTKYWMRVTHVRIGGRVSFVGDDDLRYHWEELPPEIRRRGVLDELRPHEEVQ